MKALIIVAAAIALSACAEGGPQGGVANYDALKQASDACRAKGGHLELQRDSAPEDLANYSCEKN
ncbi:MAG TPA: hypothetical protein VHW05_07145 [Phenylobacterium sp.]|jgi:uncharacterized lipoprotein YmbA|nr:hypothetical protein [Phenylobacterium sp.]